MAKKSANKKLVRKYNTQSKKDTRITNSYAMASFVLSLLFWIPALNIIFSVLSIVFGFVGLKELKCDKMQKGKPFAITGIVIGFVTLALAIIGFVFFPENFST